MIKNIFMLYIHCTTKPQYEDLEESSGDESAKRRVHFRETIWVHV